VHTVVIGVGVLFIELGNRAKAFDEVATTELLRAH
jgi:hypothetical protein